MLDLISNTAPRGDYDDIGEQARSLSRTLQYAPAQESHSAAALRHYLINLSLGLAQVCDKQVQTIESGMNYSEEQHACQNLLGDMRQAASELCSVPNIIPPGIQGLLEAFAERFLPETLLALRPNGLHGYTVRKPLKNLPSLLEHLHLDSLSVPKHTPKRLLILRYPQGEQNNVLQACCFLRYFHETKGSIFAASMMGPAYFFAFASEVRTSYTYNAGADLPYLCFVYEMLQSQGWLEHPEIGPLLNQWRDFFGFTENYLQNYSLKVLDKSLISEIEEAKENLKDAQVGFTPEIYDRDVPRLRERLRNLMPPNDLQMNAIESEEPADVMSIMNAGWSFKLLHMTELHQILGVKTAEDRFEANQVLNRLLTKGVELSRISTQWRRVRG